MLPLMNREIPVIADEYVDMEMGGRLSESDTGTRP